MITLFFIFITAASVQLIYWALFFGFFAFSRRAAVKSSVNDLPYVSIIICARNEASNLRKNLPIILQQDYPLFELIVVDDASEDQSLSLLNEFAANNNNFKFISIPKKDTPGKKTALINGISQAKSEWILLCDADCSPIHKGWIKSMMECRISEKTEIILGYAPYRKHPGLLNQWIRFETVYTAVQYFSAAFWKIPYMGVGRNLLYKKSVFNKFKDILINNNDIASGDDDLFINSAADKSNTNFCINPKSFVFSEPKRSAKALYVQKSRHFSSSVRYKNSHKVLLGFLNLSHILFWLLLIPAFVTFSFPTLIVFSIRATVIFTVWMRLTKIFSEKDLKFNILVFDPLLLLYYIIFIPALNAKHRKWK